jgi:hypothetical protein
MAESEPTFRIDPIEPSQVETRFTALIDRLEGLLLPEDVTTLRSLLDTGDFEGAYDLLDGITNDGTISVDTATLVEMVLLGQAIRST